MRQLSFVKRAATATKVCTMQQHYLSLHFFQHGQKWNYMNKLAFFTVTLKSPWMNAFPDLRFKNQLDKTWTMIKDLILYLSEAVQNCNNYHLRLNVMAIQ